MWIIIGAIGYYPVERGDKGAKVYLTLFRICVMLVMLLRTAMNMLILYMLVQFSKPQGVRIFDKVVKQKFLLYFD